MGSTRLQVMLQTRISFSAESHMISLPFTLQFHSKEALFEKKKKMLPFPWKIKQILLNFMQTRTNYASALIKSVEQEQFLLEF